MDQRGATLAPVTLQSAEGLELESRLPVSGPDPMNTFTPPEPVHQTFLQHDPFSLASESWESRAPAHGFAGGVLVTCFLRDLGGENGRKTLF